MKQEIKITSKFKTQNRGTKNDNDLNIIERISRIKTTSDLNMTSTPKRKITFKMKTIKKMETKLIQA